MALPEPLVAPGRALAAPATAPDALVSGHGTGCGSLTPVSGAVVDAYPDALAMAAALRRGDLAPREALDAVLSRIRERNDELGAITWVDEDDAYRRAATAAERLRSGDQAPFLGVPLPVKDLHPVAGWPLTYGSRGGPAAPCATSSLAVEALEAAGFVLVGRTNTPEFGELPATEGDRFPPARNPWNPTRTAGGSSGGAAAAVAGGLVPIAHGSDGGGSIRIPSAFCSLVGLKPARGRVPSRRAPWFGLSTEGVLARSVRDQAAVFAELAKPRPGSWVAVPEENGEWMSWLGHFGRLKVGVCVEAPFGLPVDEARALAAEDVARALAEVGHAVSEVRLALSDALVEAVSVVVGAAISEHDDVDWTKVEPHTRAERERALETSAAELVHQLGVLQDAGSALAAELPGNVDVLVTPTVAVPPPPVGQVVAAAHAAAGTGAPALEVVSLAAFTMPWNIAGLAALSIPSHLDADGLPIGVQLVARGGLGEPVLLALGSALEELYGWVARRPPALPH